MAVLIEVAVAKGDARCFGRTRRAERTLTRSGPFMKPAAGVASVQSATSTVLPIMAWSSVDSP